MLPPATIDLTTVNTSKEGIVKTLWSIRNLSESTQKTYNKLLKHLDKNTDLNNPRETEEYIFDKDVSSKTIDLYLTAYQHYTEANELDWKRPSLDVQTEPIKIPTEKKIDLIVSSATPRYALVFQIAKHGLRPHEISKITLRDIALDNGQLTVRTSKLGLERTLKLRRETQDLLTEYVKRNKIENIDRRLFAKQKTLSRLPQ